MLSKTCHAGVAAALLLSFQWSLRAAEVATPVRRYVPNDAAPATMSIPANLITSDIYRSLIERMLRGSRTFRRQCIRLASKQGWIVHIRMRSAGTSHGVRALTTMHRSAEGDTTAIVDIFEPQHGVELIAHELEHVLERIDGVDLRLLATVSDSGVHALGPNRTLYETRRARRVGVIVSQEMHASAGRW